VLENIMGPGMIILFCLCKECMGVGSGAKSSSNPFFWLEVSLCARRSRILVESRCKIKLILTFQLIQHIHGGNASHG